MTSRNQRLAENVARIRERIAAAAAVSGRGADAVTLVAVTKYVPADIAAALADTGCRDLGESRPQQLWEKAAALAGRDVRWHMIGHMQRNKLRRTLPLLNLLHSGDSDRLLIAANESAVGFGQIAPVLLEVNVSGDPTKHGFTPESLREALPRLIELPNLRIRGLMCMAGRETGDAGAHRDFAQLAELRHQLMEEFPGRLSLDDLSMGMSQDFEIAIQQGATIVRVGSALFAGVMP